MLCLVTRIESRKLSTVAWVVIAALRMRRQARVVSGLHEVALFVRRPRTVYIVSLWEDEAAMADFATAVPSHALAVGHLWQGGGRSWSALFELVGPSPLSMRWPEATSRGACAER